MGDDTCQTLVFISYSSADRPIAEAACRSLEDAGIRSWIAPRDVKGGRFYPSQIVQAIRRSNTFLLIFSESANTSEHVLQELERATTLGVPVLAVRLGDVTPNDNFSYFLGVRHWIEPATDAAGAPDFRTLPEHVRAVLVEKQRKAGPASEQDFEAFGHFRILRREDGSLFRLGKGGMGETFKARDTALDRVVALKVISASLLGSTSVRERFIREAKAAAKIHHPHVATVFHFGQEGDTYFYAMEFVDGEDLERYVQARGPLPVPLALRVAHQVAQGLEAADEQKLVHRDIKPSNVMAVWKKELNVKLIDFGLAKNLDPHSIQESVLSGRGDFLGTVAFASPEQCKAAVLDVRSDIYSLGVTLWYLLTGKRPFAGSAAELIGSHLYKTPPFEKLEGVPEPVVGLLGRMLEKEPDARPLNPQALQDEIQTITSGLASEFVASVKPPEPLIPAPTGSKGTDLVDSVAVDAPEFTGYLTPAAGESWEDDYRLEEEAVEGVGGRLFKVSGPARDRAKVPLAVKLLHPALAQNPAILDRLAAEIDLVFQVRQEQLIGYFGFNREARVPFLVREWVHGFSLLDLLRWKGSVRAAEMVGLLSGVPEALDLAARRGLGLFEFTLRKSFVVCPESVEPVRFREFVRDQSGSLADCRLKLNPVSLAPLLLRSRGVWNLGTLLPDSRVQSLTQAAAGIEATKGVRLLAHIIYELLSGHASHNRRAKQYPTLAAIDEAGNRLLREAMTQPASNNLFTDCQSFWRTFASSLELPVQSRRGNEPAAVVPPAEVRLDMRSKELAESSAPGKSFEIPPSASTTQSIAPKIPGKPIGPSPIAAVNAFVNRGNAYHSLKEYDKAIADYSEAIRLKPDYAEAFQNRGSAYGALGQDHKAIADYSEAIRLKPDYAEALNNRGLAYDNLKQYDKAIADYTEAIRDQPQISDFYDNRGNAYFHLGDISKAEADYKKAQELKGIASPTSTPIPAVPSTPMQ